MPPLKPKPLTSTTPPTLIVVNPNTSTAKTPPTEPFHGNVVRTPPLLTVNELYLGTLTIITLSAAV